MVRTIIDAQARPTHRAGTLRRQRSRTRHIGRIALHVEQSRVEATALYAVQTRFGAARETRGSHPTPSHRNRQPYRRDGDVGP